MSKQVSLRELHRPDHVLLLPNVWDAATALLFQDAGAEAIATTSAGFAWANGYADGSLLPRRILLDGVAAIARVTTVPVTVDLEGGYSDDPAVVAELVGSLLVATHVNGINIEDGTAPPELLEKKIRAIRQAADECGSDLFVNARTDVYLADLVAEENALGETLERAARYRAAGCDGFFVPGLTDVSAIKTIVNAIDLPVNVMLSSALPDLHELRAIGVRRLSAGASISLHAYDSARKAAAAFLKIGPRAEFVSTTSLSFTDVNALMASRARE